LLNAFKHGKCASMLLPTEQLEAMRAGAEPYDKFGKKGNCNLRKVGDVLLAIPVAAPINRDLDHAFSYIWSKEKFAGKMKMYKERRSLPQPECETQDGLRAGATPMGIGDLLGGLFFVVALMLASIVMYVIGWGRHSVHLHEVLDPDDDEDNKKEESTVMLAIRDLETALKAQGIPVNERRPDNLTEFFRQAKTNPKRFMCVCGIFITTFIIFSLFIFFLRTADM